MEPFYDGDLKDIWDSDLDPTDSLKISTDSDINDWFLEREIKDPTVILNDKLISDALFNGTVPIKSEHSYSLNSDGDSQPNSPKNLHTKMDDMEDECYPAISLKTATSNLRHHQHSLLLHHPHTATIDPKCLTIASSSLSSVSPAFTSSAIFTTSSAANSLLSSSNSSPTTATYTYHHNGNIFAGLNKLASAPMTVNLRSLESHSVSGDTSGGTTTTIAFTKQLPLQQLQQQSQFQIQQQQHQHHHQQHNLPHMLSALTSANIDSECHSPMSSSRDGSISPDICSDIEIDETCIKDEPMSPESSCPPSPNTTAAALSNGSLTLNMANMAAFTKSDLVFEHKNGCLQLTPASQSLLKSQQVILGNTSAANSTTVAAVNNHNIIIPKFNIKTELKTVSGATTGTFITTTASSPLKNAKVNGGVYGLPLTPPSSLPSDDSEGNSTPEHLLSPLSPNNSAVSITAVGNGNAGNSSAITPASTSVTARRSTSSSSSSSSSHGGSGNSHHHHHRGGINSGAGSSTRQPIHTPLISSQPKGSTGTLILTEEEKRTLLAEGYPIPQKLPLTKAEEKSLKKIRRKIKNKISAQESRRKKKEYMDQLERRVEILVTENNDYRKRVELLEDSNANLLSQLQKMQALLNKQNVKK